jgi:hypothetical protein
MQAARRVEVNSGPVAGQTRKREDDKTPPPPPPYLVE